MPTDVNTESNPATGKLSLFASVLGVPVLWLVHLQLTYMLVPWVCVNKKHLVLHIETIICLALMLIAALLCLRDWRRASIEWPSGEQEGREARLTFIPVLGMMVSGIFFLTILAQWIPSFFIDPCHQ